MALILPKGIVVNSDQIESNIGSIDMQPLDEADIAKIWKVYTTTQRRLLDPTAERLENLWWRIWGSRRKTLNGATVARLFAQISDGETFVPLRGPPNRLEGSPPLTTNSRRGPGASSTNNISQPARGQPGATPSSVASRPAGPIPHPILKKTRGPSSTGPRPTARFISPHESQDEGDITSSLSSNSHVTVQPPSPTSGSQDSKSDKKTAVAPAKKTFVASKKKRPVIVRRQSSQTSQAAPDPATTTVRSRHSESGPSSSVQTYAERTPQEQARGKAPSKFQENFSPVQRSSGSAQTLKQQVSRDTDSRTPTQRSSARKGAGIPSETILAGDPGPSSQLRRKEKSQNCVGELFAEELEELELQRMLLEEANARVRQKESQVSQATQTPVLSESANEGLRIVHNSLRPKTNSSRNTTSLLQHDSKGTISAAPTFTDASGQMNLGSVGNHSSPITDAMPRTADKGKGRDPEEAQRVAMFAKRPVQPVQAAASSITSEPMSRSKSQLTLLLEKDREPRSRSKSQLTLLLEKDRERGNVKKSDRHQDSGKKK